MCILITGRVGALLMQQHLLSASQAHIICACPTLSHRTLVIPIDIELHISKGEKEGRHSGDIRLQQPRSNSKWSLETGGEAHPGVAECASLSEW